MKTWEKAAVAAGIVLVLYMVMKEDKEKGEYEYQRRAKGQFGQYQPWERKSGSRS